MKSTGKITDTIFAMFLALLIITASSQAFAQGGTWETKAPMPTARWGAASGVINGKLYVAGGYAGTVGSATTEAYTPFLQGDANGDGKLGLDDAIYILQVLSGVR